MPAFNFISIFIWELVYYYWYTPTVYTNILSGHKVKRTQRQLNAMLPGPIPGESVPRQLKRVDLIT